MTPFSCMLKNLRHAHAMKQKTMASRLKISAARLSGIESGNMPPPGKELLDEIAIQFGLTPVERE